MSYIVTTFQSIWYKDVPLSVFVIIDFMLSVLFCFGFVFTFIGVCLCVCVCFIMYYGRMIQFTIFTFTEIT